MQQAYVDNLSLPWSIETADNRRFRRTLIFLAIIGFGMGITIPLVDLPDRPREEVESLPPQLAHVILERRVIEPKVEPVIEPPKPVEPKQEKKEEPKKIEEPKKVEEPKPQLPVERAPEVRQPVEAKSRQEAAREVAKSSGLLALNDQLADMREATSAADYKTATTTGKATAARAEKLVSDVSTKTSGGVAGTQLAAVSERVGTGTRQTSRLEAPVSGASSVTAPESGNGRGKIASSRSAEEIRRVFDTNKTSINAIYNRALRSNPSLQGQILLELTITPAGTVADCKVVSSELGDPELERRILARVKLFQFGQKEVKEQVITYPLVFLPS